MTIKQKRKQAPAQRRVVGYVRISRRRDEETSTASQEAAIRAYCAMHGWFLVDVIVESGRSAWKDSRSSRPGFQAAMALIESGAADTFIVWKLDRAARNTLDLLKFVREDLEGHGAYFVSVTEHFDTTTPMGRAMMTIVAALAELESAQKSDRAFEWHEGRRAHKLVPVGPPALGYRRELDEDENPIPNTLEPDPETAPLVQGAVDRVLAGESIVSIQTWLADNGLNITRPGLMHVLRSPTLAGLLSLEPEGEPGADDVLVYLEGEWEPLVDRDTWDTLCLVLNDPGRRSNTTNVLQHPLRPLLRCHCGGAMRRQGDNRRYQAARYVCVEPSCANGITQGPVDERVTQLVLDSLDDSTWRALRATGRASGPDPEQVEADLKRMWKMVMDKTLDMEEYGEYKLKVRGELAAATSPLNDLPDVDSIREAWKGLDPRQHHLVFKRAIRSCIIQPATRRGKGVDLTRVNLVLAD